MNAYRTAAATLVAIALAALATRGIAQKAQPNILWIIGEDLGPDLACYGRTPEVRTPHLDRLAAEGTRFQSAFATCPVCSPSRSAFMTGMYQTTIGAHNHRSHRDDGYRLPEGVRLLSHRLRDAGYFTANLRVLTDKGDRFHRGTGKTDWNFQVEGKPFDGARWNELKDRQPFYAQVNFSETHRGGAWDNAHKHIDTPADPAKVRVPSIYPEHPEVRQDWAQYLNAVMSLDKKVGKILDLLERDGLTENTIVVFLGDHGRAMVRGKQWCYDSGLRVPLIVRWPAALQPKGVTPGAVDRRLVNLLDVTATTLDWAGFEKPLLAQGRVLFGPRKEPDRTYVFGARDRCDETPFRIRTVRDQRYRYIRNFHPERPFLQLNRYKERTYPTLRLMRQLHENGELTGPATTLFAPTRPREELYDLTADPDEVRNLAEDPQHATTMARLRGALDTWIQESGDQGHEPEPQAVLDFWEGRMKAAYQKWLDRNRKK